MAREICIKTRDGVYCKSSPIKECSCRQKTFEDPYGEADRDLEAFLTDTEALLTDLRAVLNKWKEFDKVDPDKRKLGVIAKIARLILLKQVKLHDAIVITAFDHPEVSTSS